MVGEMLASGRYPAMVGTYLRLSRMYGGRAFAARIVAAFREDEAGVRAEVAPPRSRAEQFRVPDI
jgi:hypothetical protein